ncbi:OsmC family protein [Kiloniella laminariae]|uniref:OsmC family protein n=1 Tax=Kiloniella laminariae TaxID=454162 RepID=A0ABT4LIE8_9PROT|nr:OsmC family protein [Kiloniella laminariae]MCZ4280884.1 OsmC family protein [Kiloniella laminariae]
MVAIAVELRNIEGTEAAMGWAGYHTIIVDRPEGKAGGLGLGFNGAQLLALAIGGCFCNDLRYVAESMGVQIRSLAVMVSVDLSGTPLIATSAAMKVNCTLLDGSDPAPLIKQAKESCMVSNSLSRGIPVSIENA